MQFALTPEQGILAETFSRFFDEHSSLERVRASEPLGFDSDLWRAAGDLGLFSMRVPEEGFGAFDAALVMEAAGKRLASGPLVEAVLAARLLSLLAPGHPLFPRASRGEVVAVLVPLEAREHTSQVVPGAAVADAIVFLHGERVLCWERSQKAAASSNHASQPLAELSLVAQGAPAAWVVAHGAAARATFLELVEEWKLLTAALLNGLGRQAVTLAADYARERLQFGRPIGSFQAVSHPLADRLADLEGSRLLLYSALAKAALKESDASAEISLAFWWAAQSSSAAVQRALHTFGGYGLTNEYAIQLYQRRAKGWALAIGDPADELLRAGARAWLGVEAALPNVGDVPVDFSLGTEADEFANETRAFFRDHLTAEIRSRSHYSFAGHDWSLNRAMGERRLLFPTWKKEYGGRDANRYVAAAAMAVWDEFDVTIHAQSVSNMVGHVIARFGSDELKGAYLRELAAGRIISCLGYTEPSSGSDVFAARTRAARDGAGWRIHGQKMFTSGANLASHVLLLTRTDPDAAKHQGITLFIVPLSSPGVEIHPIQTYQDELTNATFYNDVYVADTHRVGPVNGGAEVLSWALSLEQGGGGFCGPHRRLVDTAVEWARHTLRGAGQAIQDPRVLERLARAHAQARVSQLIFYRSLWLLEQGSSDRAAGPMSKLFSSEAFLRDANDLLDLAAPDSLLRGKTGPGYIELSARHASGTTIYGGTSEIHRSQVAEKALGLPRSR